jgi:putative ABC transport system permease protein
MLSAQQRISVAELTRRRSRSLFAVFTLALAVASIGLFAMPTLIDQAMHEEVVAGRLADVSLSSDPLALGRARLAQLAALPNVSAVEPHSYFATRVYVGARRAPAYVLGVPDFRRQSVDVVHLASGAWPRRGELLTEAQDARQGLFAGETGQSVRLIAADGSLRRLRISGVGRNLNGGQDATSDNTIVLYASPATVAALSGVHGYSSLSFLLHNTQPASVAATIAAVRRALRGTPGFAGFTDLPEVRAAGSWPGKAEFDQIVQFFYVITMLALLSALVLISNTMTTIVAEQTSQIGVMKAIGGRRRQIGLVYVKTALLLGALGSAVGVVAGVLLSNLLVGYLGSTLFAINVGFGIDPRIVLVSMLVGVVGPPLAALPAIRRGVRVDLREALEATGSAVGAQDAADRALRRIRFLPRTMQVGLRNVGRRKRRSLSTVLIVALAVGNLLAILGFATAVSDTAHAQWRDHGEDVKVTSQGGRPLDARAARLMRAAPGVATVEPMFTANVKLAGKNAVVWSMQQQTMFRYHIAAGRWFTPAEQQARAHVAVLQQAIAHATGTRLGDRITLQTAAGPVVLQVVGIATNQQEFGTALYVPLTTMHAILGDSPAATNDYWVQTTSHDHASINRTTTRIENTLTTSGYTVGSEIEYVGEANDVATFRSITTTIAVLGFLIVAISMVALANAMTMSMIERTREIGILRCLGARTRDLRRIFATEGITLATLGWLLGIPLGYLLDSFLVWLTKQILNIDIPTAFPAWNPLLALAGTIMLALLVTLAPLRRAVHLKPGDALRHT